MALLLTVGLRLLSCAAFCRCGDLFRCGGLDGVLEQTEPPHPILSYPIPLFYPFSYDRTFC